MYYLLRRAVYFSFQHMVIPKSTFNISSNSQSLYTANWITTFLLSSWLCALWNVNHPESLFSPHLSPWFGLLLHSLLAYLPQLAISTARVTTLWSQLLCSPVIPTLLVLNRHQPCTVCFLGSCPQPAKHSWKQLWKRAIELTESGSPAPAGLRVIQYFLTSFMKHSFILTTATLLWLFHSKSWTLSFTFRE